MSAWPDGYGRRVLAEVDSTLDEAARLAPGLAGPEWILALRQTKGRGRRGRAWQDPTGNFAATLVLRPEGDLGQAALRSFVMALALYQTCVAVSGQTQGFALKWPNDVLLNDGKLAGILLESGGTAQTRHLSIGVGVNLTHAPAPEQVEAGAVAPVCLAAETGVSCDAEQFLTELAQTYARLEEQFVTYGFEPIRRAWLDQAARLGEEITARMPSRVVTGTFETVDEAGHLVVLTPEGRVAIPAADIFF